VILADATAEVEEMQQWCRDRMRRDVEALAAGHKLISPSEIWHIVELDELANDDRSDIDEAKLAAIIEERVPEQWRVQVKYAHGRIAGPVHALLFDADYAIPPPREAGTAFERFAAPRSSAATDPEVVLRPSRHEGFDDQRDHPADRDEAVRRAGERHDEHGEHQRHRDDGDDGDGEILRKMVHTNSASN
jgi:hypothetical protein